jgi:hypothetical protein
MSHYDRTASAWGAELWSAHWAMSGAGNYPTGLSANGGAAARYHMISGQRWAKCPFCGYRQNIEKDGGNCIRCGGDLFERNVL